MLDTATLTHTQRNLDVTINIPTTDPRIETQDVPHKAAQTVLGAPDSLGDICPASQVETASNVSEGTNQAGIPTPSVRAVRHNSYSGSLHSTPPHPDDIEAGLSGELTKTYQPVWARMSRASQLAVFKNAQKLLKQLFDDQTQIVRTTAAEGTDYTTLGITHQNIQDEEYQALLQPYIIAAEYSPREWRRLGFTSRVPQHVQLCFFRALVVWAQENKALTIAAVLPDGVHDTLTDEQRTYLTRLDSWFVPLTAAMGSVILIVIGCMLWLAVRTGYATGNHTGNHI